MKPELPELQLIRNSFECTSKLAEELLQSEETVSVMAVPQEMHDEFKQKFELYSKMQECANCVKEYVKKHLKYTQERCLVIDVPPDIHSMLMDRYDPDWDVDSRIEVFENLRTYIEKELEKPKMVKEIKKACGADINYILFIQGIMSRDDDLERDYRMEIHFKRGVEDVSLLR